MGHSRNSTRAPRWGRHRLALGKCPHILFSSHLTGLGHLGALGIPQNTQLIKWGEICTKHWADRACCHCVPRSVEQQGSSKSLQGEFLRMSSTQPESNVLATLRKTISSVRQDSPCIRGSAAKSQGALTVTKVQFCQQKVPPNIFFSVISQRDQRWGSDPAPNANSNNQGFRQKGLLPPPVIGLGMRGCGRTVLMCKNNSAPFFSKGRPWGK